MKLSKRLEAIVNMISNKNLIVDIGTDHGHIPIHLATIGGYSDIYGTEIIDGPLEIASANLDKYLGANSNKVKLVKTDGLDFFWDNDIIPKTVIVAGMGANTILEILNPPLGDELILHPTNNEQKLRALITYRGYKLVDEAFIYENEIYSIVMKFSKNEGKDNSLSDEDTLLGPILKNKKDPVYIDYVKEQVEKLEKILEFRKDENMENDLSIYKSFLSKP